MIFADRIKRWATKKLETVLDRYYEGPEPPERLTQLVLAFVELYPHATRADWMRFAIDFGKECYRSGYQRGAEYVERAPETWRPDMPPEMVADALDPDWRWRSWNGGIGFGGHDVPVHEEPDEEERFLEEIERTRKP